MQQQVMILLAGIYYPEGYIMPDVVAKTCFIILGIWFLDTDFTD